MTTVVLKVSLAIFFLRVVVAKWQVWTICSTTTIFALFGFSFFFVSIFQCGNPSHFLEHSLQGRCLPTDVVGPMVYLHGALNAATDWVFAIIPIFVLWKAKMPIQTKISAGFVLLLGTASSCVSVYRLRFLKGLSPGPDFFATAMDAGVWSLIEPGLGIIAGSLATLRPLFRCCFEKVRTTLQKSSVGASQDVGEASCRTSRMSSSVDRRHDPAVGPCRSCGRYSPPPAFGTPSPRDKTIATVLGEIWQKPELVELDDVSISPLRPAKPERQYYADSVYSNQNDATSVSGRYTAQDQQPHVRASEEMTHSTWLTPERARSRQDDRVDDSTKLCTNPTLTGYNIVHPTKHASCGRDSFEGKNFRI